MLELVTKHFIWNQGASFLVNKSHISYFSRQLCTSSSNNNKKRFDPLRFWPDGTPKRFTGKDHWKNFINYESKHKSQSDELNRARHYFFSVDSKGRLWRKELHDPEKRYGQIRDSRVLDFFFGHMQRNNTSLYVDTFPYISFRMHEHYFTQCEVSPIVFNDLTDNKLLVICPDGNAAKSVTTQFSPDELRVGNEGYLYHPVKTKAISKEGEYYSEVIYALLDVPTAQPILERMEPLENGSFLLNWEGKVRTIPTLHD
jgi:hypothetical protein